MQFYLPNKLYKNNIFPDLFLKTAIYSFQVFMLSHSYMHLRNHPNLQNIFLSTLTTTYNRDGELIYVLVTKIRKQYLSPF